MNSVERSGSIIAILGTTGAGKSTFAEHMGETLQGIVLHETTEGNRFIDAAHTTEGAIFQNQVWFLLQSVGRHSQAQQLAENGKLAIMDTFAPSNIAHSQLGLETDSFELYKQLSDKLTAHLAKPNLVILLSDSPHYIMERLRRRRLTHDSNTTTSFIQDLNRLHNIWAQSTNLPVYYIRSRDLENAHIEAEHIEKIRQKVFS